MGMMTGLSALQSPSTPHLNFSPGSVWTLCAESTKGTLGAGISSDVKAAEELHPKLPAGFLLPPRAEEHVVLEHGGDDCENEEAEEGWVLGHHKALQRCSGERILKPSMGLRLRLAKEQQN